MAHIARTQHWFRSPARVTLAGLVAVAAAGMLAACGSGGNSSSSANSTTVTLTAKNTTYSPTAISLKAGDKVTFVVDNSDSIKHNLTVKDLNVDKDVDPGKTAKDTLVVKAGTYEFHCEYHPDQMKGTITVA